MTKIDDTVKATPQTPLHSPQPTGTGGLRAEVFTPPPTTPHEPIAPQRVTILQHARTSLQFTAFIAQTVIKTFLKLLYTAMIVVTLPFAMISLATLHILVKGMNKLLKFTRNQPGKEWHKILHNEDGVFYFRATLNSSPLKEEEKRLPLLSLWHFSTKPYHPYLARIPGFANIGTDEAF